MAPLVQATPALIGPTLGFTVQGLGVGVRYYKGTFVNLRGTWENKGLYGYILPLP